MHRIDTPTAQKDKFGQGKNGFTRGNPQTGTPATQLDYLYFDAVQEEIVNVIESAGFELNKEEHDQLKRAIQQHVINGKVKLSSATNSTSETEAATPQAVKSAYDLAGQAKWDANNHKINGKKLNTDITLSATDVGALSIDDFKTQLGNPGFEVMPSGLIRQWGTIQLPITGDYNSVQVGNIKIYTNYQRIVLPIAFLNHPFSVNVTIASGTLSNQSSMFGLSASAHLEGSPTAFTVAISSPTLGTALTIHYEIIGS